METTNFVRKIDSMGRIVIPKDLRNKINIKDDDSLEISLEHNYLKIFKHSFNNCLNKIDNYVSVTKDLIDGQIFITSKTSFINDEQKIINSKLLTIMGERKDYYSNGIEEYDFGFQIISGYFAIIPFIKDCEVIGSLIIRKSSIINEYDKLYISMIKRFVENLNYLC